MVSMEDGGGYQRRIQVMQTRASNEKLAEQLQDEGRVVVELFDSNGDLIGTLLVHARGFEDAQKHIKGVLSNTTQIAPWAVRESIKVQLNNL